MSLAGPVAILLEHTEVLRVPTLDIGPVCAGVWTLGGQLPYGCEHAKPRSAAGNVNADETVPSEGIQQIERPLFWLIGDVYSCLDRPALDEDRQHGQHLPHCVGEQPDTPFDGNTQRALTLGEIGRAGTQCLEATVEPSQQCIWYQ